ncbi:MAG: hypothetical protein V7L11_20300 [Nostoc sp.]|uniref:hypothetical protein n=1 Tax=Nostoc sp. TaxID=1180 RepID=UPI002FF6D908
MLYQLEGVKKLSDITDLSHLERILSILVLVRSHLLGIGVSGRAIALIDKLR